ncbi:hypothetical protein [Streptomyces adelaidensis]|uniref:hypothetical protein n=1 Tax=Streptomyces adelaidensis TaxID=2796465 RepID=UPI003556968C
MRARPACSTRSAEPAGLREGYVGFATPEPPLKLILVEGATGEATRMDHLGAEAETDEAVHAATARSSVAGLATTEKSDTTCCYALRPTPSRTRSGSTARPGRLGGSVIRKYHRTR